MCGLNEIVNVKWLEQHQALYKRHLLKVGWAGVIIPRAQIGEMWLRKSEWVTQPVSG